MVLQVLVGDSQALQRASGELEAVSKLACLLHRTNSIPSFHLHDILSLLAMLCEEWQQNRRQLLEKKVRRQPLWHALWRPSWHPLWHFLTVRRPSSLCWTRWGTASPPFVRLPAAASVTWRAP